MKQIHTFVFILLCLTFESIIAQVPQAIPYQAVARDNAGNFIANQTIGIKFTIHENSASGLVIYDETQSPTTNNLGLFTVNIGEGLPGTGSFSGINWATGYKFLQVELDVTNSYNYVDMGTQQMLSVPYALYAASSGNIPNGTANGNTMWWNGTSWLEDFSIYNNGVNVGIGTDVPEFKLSIGNGNPFGLSDGGIMAKGIWGSGNVLTTSGAGTRMFWYPRKAAFRAGDAYSDRWDDVNIGSESAAFGYATKASGPTSFASGISTVASGSSSTAFGGYNTASGDYSTALGNTNSASGNFSLSSGTNNFASGLSSVALGEGSSATAPHSFVMGASSGAFGESSIALGLNSQAQTDLSIAIGQSSIASGFGAIAIGSGTHADGDNSMAFGVLSSNGTHYGSFVYGDLSPAPLSNYVTNTANNQFMVRAAGGYVFYNDATLTTPNAMVFNGGKMGLGVLSPAAKLDIVGNIKITDGTQGAGKVLTSNASGLASWQTPASGGGSGTVTSVGTGTGLTGGPITTTGTISLANSGVTAGTYTKLTVDATGRATSGANLAAGDIPSGSNNYIQNQTGADQSAGFRVDGNGIFNGGNVCIGTTTPEFKLSLDNDGGIIAKGTVSSGNSLTTSGSGSRMIWYPKKAAFRAGYALADSWDDINIGISSTAFGYATYAKGYTSTAMGLVSNASGDFSTAIGYYTWASGDISTAMGTGTKAPSLGETAIGIYNTSYTPSSPSNWVSTDRLLSIGNGIDASKKSDALTILKNGNTGIGTSSPSQLLSVSDGENVDDDNANSGTLANGLTFGHGSGEGIASKRTAGGNQYGLDFYTNFTNKMTILSSGNVGIGCIDPKYKLHVIGDIGCSGAVRCPTAFVTGAITACSDIRFKKTITPLQNSLQKILQLDGVNYFWKTKEFPERYFNDQKQIGLIAQEVEKIFPELVLTDSDGYKSVDYSKLTPVLVEALKELSAKNDALKSENESMKSDIEKIKSRLGMDESQLKAENVNGK